MESSIDNKRILKNSLYLYLRMFVILVIGLFTVRMILSILGVTDYGIYNVVGGVVSMFSFLSGSLATSSQRYFSIEIAKKDELALNKVFSLNLTVFILISIVLVVIAETVGLWFVNCKMTIPPDRLFAANVVYQLSILSFLISLCSVPYNALVVAYEKMSAFAWIGIVEALLKIVIVALLYVMPFDKLIVYGILTLSVSFSIGCSYYVYCMRNLRGSAYRWYWNKTEARQLMAFSGWHFLGTTSVVVRSTGINLLINMFFSPAINGARAIAYQVDSIVCQFANNYFTAVKPQMYKAYSNGEMQGLFRLIMRTTIMNVGLIMLFAFPILCNAEFLLSLWLKEVPPHTVLFVELAMVNSIIDLTSNPMIAPALATGKIKNYQLVTSTFHYLNLPISYIALRLGAEPEMTVVISIVLSFLNMFARAIMLNRMMAFPLKPYFALVGKLLLVSVLEGMVLYALCLEIQGGYVRFFVTGFLSVALLAACYLGFVLAKQDKQILLTFVNSKLSHNKKCQY